jgi:death-on-curing protein
VIKYLTVEQVIDLHRLAAGDQPLLDRGTLTSQVLRPQAGFGDYEAYPTVFHKAAVLLHGLASTQCFQDGNKRAAWIAAVTFLELNGFPMPDVPDIEAEFFVMAVAVSAWRDDTVAKAAEWLEHRTMTAG